MKVIIKESQLSRLYHLISEQEEETVERPSGRAQEILSQYERLMDEYSKQKNELNTIIGALEPLRISLNNKKAEIEYFKRDFIPSYSINVTKTPKGNSYLMASLRYFDDTISDKRISSSLYLGKLSDYPQGKEDPKLQKIALLKSIDYLLKKKGKM